MLPRRKAHILRKEWFWCLKSLFNRPQRSADYIDKWQEQFAHFIGVKQALCTSSGRQAMQSVLQALELKANDEIIIPAYTLKELAQIIAALGLKAVPADVDPQTFNISLDSIKKKINQKTKVILATHLFGSPCPIDEITALGRERSIFVIEDCAHSLGAKFKGQQTGSFGDAAFFSLEVIKPVNTYGGGMMTTNDEKLAGKVRRIIGSAGKPAGIPFKKMLLARLENCFLPTVLFFPGLYLLACPYWHKKIYSFYRKIQGVSNSRAGFSGFQALLGMEKLNSLEQRIARRNSNALLLKSLLSPGIAAQRILEGASPNYYFFVVLLPEDPWKKRKLLLRHGVDAGIEAEIADDCAKYLGAADCPGAAEVYRRAIQIPLHEGVSESGIRRMAQTLNKL